jgi:hypothetical protein
MVLVLKMDKKCQEIVLKIEENQPDKGLAITLLLPRHCLLRQLSCTT